jgi:hypothetical protein
MGVMLIYGAFHTLMRPLILTVAGLSKLTFIALLMLFGRPFLGHQAGVALVSDVIQVALFTWSQCGAPVRPQAKPLRKHFHSERRVGPYNVARYGYPIPERATD